MTHAPTRAPRLYRYSAMANKTLALTDALHTYLVEHSVREPDILRRLRAETARDSLSMMQISPEQGQFMQLLVRLMNARNCLEIGVFTGYSSLAVASALPPDGRLIACDVSEQWTAIARRYWREAGVEHKIDLRIAPALTTLEQLLAEGKAGSIDFAFIDADKVNYLGYGRWALENLRPGGLVIGDNAYLFGELTEDSDRGRAMRSFHEQIAAACDSVCAPTPDGLVIGIKK